MSATTTEVKWADNIRVGILPVTRDTPLTAIRCEDGKTVNLGPVGLVLDRFKAMRDALREIRDNPPANSPAPEMNDQWKVECARLEKELQDAQDKLKAAESKALEKEAESLRVLENATNKDSKDKDKEIEDLNAVIDTWVERDEQASAERERLESELEDEKARASRAIENKLSCEAELQKALASNRDQITKIESLYKDIESLVLIIEAAKEERTKLLQQIESQKNATVNGKYNSSCDARIACLEGDLKAVKSTLSVLADFLKTASQ